MNEKVKTYLKWCGESFKKDEDIEDKDNPFYLAAKIIETQERQLKIKNEYLQLAYDIGFDYDGCNTVESLKGLIDNILDLTTKAYKNDDTSTVYIGGDDKKYNVLYEEI